MDVLDLFAGRNVLWSNIKHDNYFGIDVEAGKGKNLAADTRSVIGNLDLSPYNVIDCDSYGISFDIFKQLLTRPDVKSGTVVIYTAITNEFTTMQNAGRNALGFENFYDKAPSLFNARAIEFFYEFLAENGVDEVNFYAIRDNFDKHYGYFVIK